MVCSRFKRMVQAGLSAVGLYEFTACLYRALSPRRKREERARRLEARSRLGDESRAPEVSLQCYPSTRTALLVGQAYVDAVLLQLPLIAALRVSGHRIVVLFMAPAPALEEFYRKLGASSFVYLHRYLPFRTHPQAGSSLNSCRSLEELLALTWQDAACGKYAAATYMRQTRKGDFEVTNPDTRRQLTEYLSDSMNHAEAMSRLVECVQPEIVCFFDRGYTPDGELFDAALAQGANALTMNAAQKSGLLMFKRYDESNRDNHPASLSASSWEKIKAMPWSPAETERLHGELVACYRDGSWYDEIGTQFGKRLAERDELARMLELDPSKKTAAVFPHLFWDATFFWGRDLFPNYEVWFKETLKAALANDALNWIIKVHPANVIKDRRDRHRGEHSELLAIKELVLELPSHIKVMPADHPVSTFSLYGVIDYCITVRGTVGLEAACFGVPVLTAGTGRYDGMGFTIDSDSKADYLVKLADLQSIDPPGNLETELARRYAWGVFFARPMQTSCITFGYRRDAEASLGVELTQPLKGELDRCKDVQQLAAWLNSKEEDWLEPDLMERSDCSGTTPLNRGVG